MHCTVITGIVQHHHSYYHVTIEVWLQSEEDQFINEEANHLLYITDLNKVCRPLCTRVVLDYSNGP